MPVLELLTINVTPDDKFRVDIEIVNLIQLFLVAGQP
jgi:hypothetical protein